jgi:glycosyltransferase involved in cell wall biosynthesis
MKNTAVHPLTSIHRQPGGLARLNFVRNRLLCDGEKYQIGIVGWQQGNYALPLADDGHTVTVLEIDAHVREQAKQTVADCGLRIEFVSVDKLSFDKPRFDVIIVDVSQGGDATAGIETLRPYLVPRTRVFIAANSGKRFADWKTFQATLHEQGCRAVEVDVTSNAENILHSLIPLSFSKGWVVECELFDPLRPLVVHMMPTLGVGGAERLVLDVAGHLPDEGFDVHVIGMLGGGPLEVVCKERGIRFSVFEWHGPFALPSVHRIFRFLKMTKPTIVHTHLFGADAWGRLIARVAGVPKIVSTEHNINPSYGFAKRNILRLFARFTDAIIAVTETVKKVSVEDDGVPENKIRVIPNGIDMDRVISRGAHGFHDVPRLITTGRLHPQKDHATLLKALALVKRPWHLQIAGDGPLASELRALVERLGISSRVEWLGIRHDIPALLASSDLFCFPSRWEGLGNAVIEAAAAGVPVLTSDLPPVRETLSASEATFVSPGDVPAWARAIDEILIHPAPVVTMAARAVPRIRSAAALPVMIRSYADLYRELLTSRPPSV